MVKENIVDDVIDKRNIGIRSLLFSIYRSGTLNSNTVNSKFHLIRSFFKSLPDSYHFMFKNNG